MFWNIWCSEDKDKPVTALRWDLGSQSSLPVPSGHSKGTAEPYLKGIRGLNDSKCFVVPLGLWSQVGELLTGLLRSWLSRELLALSRCRLIRETETTVIWSEAGAKRQDEGDVWMKAGNLQIGDLLMHWLECDGDFLSTWKSQLWELLSGARHIHEAGIM